MSEVSVSCLDVRLQRLVENARRALEQGHHDYVIQSATEVLNHAPGCLLVRRMQRIAQLQKFKRRRRLDRLFQTGWGWARLTFRIRRATAAKALDQADQVLACDPANVSALRLLGESAHASGMFETALFAFKAIEEIQPVHRPNQLSLGAVLIELNRPLEALGIAEALLKSNPADYEARELQRKASVVQTIASGNWEAGSPFGERLGKS